MYVLFGTLIVFISVAQNSEENTRANNKITRVLTQLTQNLPCPIIPHWGYQSNQAHIPNMSPNILLIMKLFSEKMTDLVF